MINTQLGPYELREEIGKGGMATVYRAYQASIDRYVAVKVIHKNIASDEVALERFRREARLIARLEHPHILPIHDFDGTHDPPYIVMRFIDSGTLKDVLQRQQLPLNEIGYLLRQVAAALDYAHQQGIVHRDIKPSNIMLDKQGNVIVSDFGIARLVDAQQHRSVTGTGGAVGTPDYMPPEQVMGSGEIDGRADVYALGVTLFQLLTGDVPFKGVSGMAVMLQHLQAPIPAVCAANPALPAALNEVLFKALAKEPKDRFETAGALAAATVKALGETVLVAPPSLSHAAQLTAAGQRQTHAQPTTDSKATPSEQNKIVTALFANAVDYVEVMTEAKGAEAARRALRTLRERIEQIIATRDGQLIKFDEHDWLAVWGATTAYEDHAERAVRAALEMQHIMREFSREEITDSADETLPIKIGVHTGLALLTPSEKRDSFTASGIALTLAQKLGEAADGIILLSPDTYREVQGVFDVQEDAPLKVRGRKEPLPTYRVTAAKARAFRVRTQGVAGIETKMVGREAELKQLQNAYLNAYEENETQVITILGESGLGKSRLLTEFRQWADLRSETWRSFQGRATPAIMQRPYALWRDVLSFRFEILDDDPLSLVKQKMEIGVAALLGQPEAEIAHLMGHLAGFDFSSSSHVKGLLGDPKQLAARARQLTFRFFERLGKIQPIILALEDMHYADEASLDLFNDLPSVHPQLPMTIVHLARPSLLERRPTWGTGQNFHKRLTLTPLDKRESRDLARNLLQKIPEPPKVLRDLLVDRAEGNPLFMEELVLLLVEDRVILAEGDQWRVEETRLAHVRVPPSLMGVLQTRVETLLHAEKLTLQRAAAFGRIFHDSLLRAIDATDEVHLSDLPSTLKTLEARGFIQRRENSAFTGNLEYAFAQGMLRDMLYVTLLERQRRTYHTACAIWLTQTERAEEYLPLIAEHYEKAEENLKAAKYLELAGDKAMGVSGFAEAVKFYTRAQELHRLSTPNEQPTSTIIVAPPLLHLKLAEAQYRHSDFPGARATLQQAQANTKTDSDRAAVLALLGEMISSLGDYEEANKILTEAIPLARAHKDQATLSRALYALGDADWRLGKLDEAQAALQESLTLAQELNDLNRELFTLNRLGTIALQRDLGNAEQLFLKIHARALEAGNRERAMTALNNLGVVTVEMQRQEEAAHYFEQALNLAREIGSQQSIALYLINLAESDINLKRLSEARTHLREGLMLATQLGAAPAVVAAVRTFGLLAYAEGNPERSLALMNLARRQPAWSSDHQHQLDVALTKWSLDPAIVEAGLAQSAKLDWLQTIQELMG